jgi:hypothetical protein
MKIHNFNNIPTGVLLISAFYIFGAFVLLASFFTNGVDASRAIAVAHRLSPIMGVEILMKVAVLALVLAYGLIRLSHWGFILAIAYSLYLAGISLAMGGLSFLWTGHVDKQIYFGNFLWSVLVVIYLFLARRRFFKEQRSN